ncbi:MAG: FtsX-like permease family protein [Billgrantia sp.]
MSQSIMLAVLLVAMLVVGGLYWWMPGAATAYEVKEGALTQQVVASGRVVASSRAQIGSEIVGRVTERLEVNRVLPLPDPAPIALVLEDRRPQRLRSQTLSTTMIRSFVSLSAAFGIASVLAVSVVQRTREIGILRAMGLGRGRILRVFLIQGALLNLIGLLDTPTAGELFVLKRPTSAMDDQERTDLRSGTIGLVFQFHHLIQAFSVLDNVLMPLMIRQGRPTSAMIDKAM